MVWGVHKDGYEWEEAATLNKLGSAAVVSLGFFVCSLLLFWLA